MRKPPDGKTVEAIEKDLDRTFPGIEEFDDGKKRELADMLRAHAGLFPSVGYCQGMNFVAGFLLMVAGRVPDAAKDAFFLLVQMMVKYRANLLFCDGLPLLKLHTFQYRTLLQRLFPDVHRHFQDKQITPELYLTKWILTIFTQPLSIPSAARVWDLIVCDGLQAVVLIALAIVKLRRSRLLQEDTEGILDMLSMRAGEPIAGGDIVKTALALESQIAQGSISDGSGIKSSKLFAEWETACPSEVADFRRAEADICSARDDWCLSETSHESECGSVEGVSEAQGPSDGSIGPASSPPCTSIAPVCSEMQELPVAEGGEARVSHHAIAAEAKVAVNPSMPLRKPSRSTPTRSNGKRSTDTERRSPGNAPKRSSSLGCLVGPLQSGGPLATDGDPLWNSPKLVRGSSGTKKMDLADARREEANHRRTQGTAGRDAGNRALKASGSPPAPAPDIRRGNRTPVRTLSNGSWTSGIARSRSGLDLEVADEHRGLECKAIPVARKSRTSPVGSNGKPPPSPAMSSREILEDLSMHGRTWPEPMAGLIGGKEANAGTAASTPAPFTRTRSRGETGAHEPSQCGGLRGESTERSAKSPHVWEEDRRVRSLSPRGDRSQSPAGRLRAQDVQSSPARSKTLQASERIDGERGRFGLAIEAHAAMARSEGRWKHHRDGIEGQDDGEGQPPSPSRKTAWHNPPSDAWGSPHNALDRADGAVT
eukprot:CAMPEP_0181433224 /NCGR_PEP_ID=MMETSP1110-20121109/19179_1 /TAXON_ID=174948 /ORGANISM="Symbiodinium sp., Strain CCMP421" /LENGTH=709 /DNA_ID=CAMNT_0023556665 /DNA_START=391 /DNA_END=2520 /DNA_ORIENTATION=-